MRWVQPKLGDSIRAKVENTGSKPHYDSRHRRSGRNILVKFGFQSFKRLSKKRGQRLLATMIWLCNRPIDKVCSLR